MTAYCIIYLFLQIVFTLEKYGVKKIVGIPFGYHGFFDEGLSEIPVRIFSFEVLNESLGLYLFISLIEFPLFSWQLSRQLVQNINLHGGSLLGVSRGNGDINEIVDNIQVFGSFAIIFVV